MDNPSATNKHDDRVVESSGSNEAIDQVQGPRNVVVTGFGLFRDHRLNPSWEAIRDGRLNFDRSDVNIITKQVEVAYESVDQDVERLWREYDPLLMVHVGLAAFESNIRLECLARHGPYIHDDVVGEAPHKSLRQQHESPSSASSLEDRIVRRNYSCKPCQFDCSRTCLDVDRVCDTMRKAYKDGRIAIPAIRSDDAGLYVCEYIYQKSLRICDRAVFIHVPDVENFKIEDITVALRLAIETLIDQALNHISRK